jgi:transcriptional regulator with XRE-family HTH domain
MDPVIDPGLTPGQRIKLFRTRAGLTQEVCAQLVGVSLSTWRKWEAGLRQVLHLHQWIDIARVLRVRDLYRLTGLPIGELPDEPAEHPSVGPIRTALHAYLARPDEPPDLDGLRRSVEFAWDTWHGSPSRYSRTGPLLPELICSVRAAAVGADDRRTAHQILADLYLLVRAYTKRVGAQDLSLMVADRAMAAAQIADDPTCIAAAAWNIVAVLSTQGHVEAAAALARDALADLAAVVDEHPTPERLAVTGSLNLLLAVQEARLRNEHASQAALAEAERAASAVGENNAFRLVFGPTNVAMHRVATSLELSRAGEAQRVSEQIDVKDLPSIERRFTHWLDLAKGYAVQREDLSAVHMLQRAEQESPEEARLNVVYRAIVREMLSRETPTTRPDLRPLAERVGVI